MFIVLLKFGGVAAANSIGVFEFLVPLCSLVCLCCRCGCVAVVVVVVVGGAGREFRRLMSHFTRFLMLLPVDMMILRMLACLMRSELDDDNTNGDTDDDDDDDDDGDGDGDGDDVPTGRRLKEGSGHM